MKSIYLFLKDSDFKLEFGFEDETWLQIMIYCANIFFCLNETNAFIKNSACSVFTMHMLSQKKLVLENLRLNMVECFPILHEFFAYHWMPE